MEKSSKDLQNSEKNKKENIAARLAIAIAALGYKHTSEFIEDIGVKKSTIYAILNGSTKDPGSRILEKCYYAGINLNWLITGEEEMLLSQTVYHRTASKPYPPMPETRDIGEKIKDTMDDMLGMYQRLKKLTGYASELEKLSPEQEKMFHSLINTFLESS
ncbi:MAG: hypothetical protein ACE5I1_07520, partial [bacterium]